MCEHPCPCHQDPFWGTHSLHLYLIFRCSHTVCFCLYFPQSGMKHTGWITMQWWCGCFNFHFSKKNERICILQWSANIFPGFFSSTVKLKKKKGVDSAISNTTVTQCFVSICKYLPLLPLWLKIIVKIYFKKEASVYIRGHPLLLKIKIIWPKSYGSVCLMPDIFFFSSAFKFWEQEKLHLESRGCQPPPGNAVPEPGSLPWHHHSPHQCGGCRWTSCIRAQLLLCGSARGRGDWNHHTDHFCQGPRRDQQLHQVCPIFVCSPRSAPGTSGWWGGDGAETALVGGTLSF